MYPLRRALTALAISMAVPVCAAQAATFVVDRDDDADVSACSAAANDCTLRGAINKANVSAGADTINFVTSDTQTIDIRLTEISLPAIAGELTISAPSVGLIEILPTLDGHLFTVPAGANLSLRGLILRGGADSSDGNRGGMVDNAGIVTVRDCGLAGNGAASGALYNAGTLTLVNSFLTSNLNGSGVRNLGELTVRGCTFSDNTSTGRGAGIDNTGALTVTGSAFLDNTAGADGAGIFTVGSRADISNSTFSGNRIPSGARGGAICSGDGGLAIDSSTITRNTADAGNGGGFFCKSNGTVRNSIVVGNNGDDVSTTNTAQPPFRSLGYNIVGTGAGGGAVGRFSATGDQVGVTDARLGPLTSKPRIGSFFQDQFYPLLADSPAINRGNTELTVDQRGVVRPQGSADDIGAYEFRAAEPETPSSVVTTLADVVANDGQTSLREAIAYALAQVGIPSIEFRSTVRGTITLNGTQLPTITKNLAINGPGAGLLSIQGDGKSRALEIATDQTVSVSGLTFSGGKALRGGAILNNGKLTLQDCVFSGNAATQTEGLGGGAISNNAEMTVLRCTLANNTAVGRGGALDNVGFLDINSSTFNNNTAGADGGGLFTVGVVDVRNSTFSGNVIPAAFRGGGICSGDGGLTVDSSTFTLNRAAAGFGGGLFCKSNGTLRNTIVAGNLGDDVASTNTGTTPFRSGGYNLIGSGDAANRFNQTGDQSGVADARLAALADNGGPTRTHAPNFDSSAINRGNTELGRDQRNVERPQGSADDIGAVEVVGAAPPGETPSLVVTTLVDAVASDGQNSLREAINFANLKAGADTISFASGLTGTIKLNGTPLPTITDALTIQGNGQQILDGDGKSRILQNNRTTLTLNLLTLRGGQSNDSGGAITTSFGELNVFDCVLSDNRAVGAGAIYNGTGVLTVRRSTFSGNASSKFNGGAITNLGTMRVSDTTFSGNVSDVDSTISTSGRGGAIFTVSVGNELNRFSETTIFNCTFSGNRAGRSGGGFHNGNAASSSIEGCTFTLNAASDGAGISSEGNGEATRVVTIKNTIIAGNAGRSDIFDVNRTNQPLAFNSRGYNLVGTGIANFNATGDVRTTDAKLGPLGNNGGSTQTHAPLAGSPAIDKGETDLATDQRGLPRPVGSADDIGAYEVQAATPPPTTETPSLRVTTLADIVANDGQTSLREALNFANAKSGADTISFADNVRGKLTLSSPLPAIADALTIDGPGAPNLAIDGGGKVRLICVGSGVNVALNGLTFSGAFYDADAGPEGAILNRGNLNLNYVALTGNTGIEGAALLNIDGTISIQGTLISGNTAVRAGGGITNNNGVVTAINSSIVNNTVTGGTEGGGGVSTYGENARLIFDCVTLTGNSAPNVAGNTRAGVWMEGGSFAPHNSIIYGNGARDLQVDGGNLNSAGYNIVGVAGARAGLVGSDLIGVDPRLAELANNGGPTQTRALLAGSPAINTGDPAIRDGFDQRGGGFPRVRGGRVDIGAFEVQSDNSVFGVELSPQAPKTNETLRVSASQSLDGATFVWRKNGEVLPNETSATLNLGKAGNGDKNDVVSVTVTKNGASANSSVQVVNSVPIAVSSQGTVDVAIDKAFPLLGFDADGDPLKFIRVGGPRNGVRADINKGEDGVTRLTYRSRPKYGGVDVIRYVVQDDSNAISNESTLGISVNYTPPAPVNRKPIAGDTNIDTFVNTSVIKGLLGTDPDGDAVTFRIVNNARFGTSEIKRDTDGLFKLFYTSLPKFYGPDRVTYIAVDKFGAESNVATVNIRFTNRKPVANGNRLTVASGELVSQFLFGSDEDRDELSFRLVNNPQNGTGEIKRDEFGNWRVYYRSRLGYVGPDQITFIAIDPQGRESFAAAADINVVRVAGTPEDEGSAVGAATAPREAPAKAPSGGNS